MGTRMLWLAGVLLLGCGETATSSAVPTDASPDADDETCVDAWRSRVVEDADSASGIALDSNGGIHMLVTVWDGDWWTSNGQILHVEPDGDGWRFDVLTEGTGHTMIPLGIRSDPRGGVLICWQAAAGATCVSGDDGAWTEEPFPVVADSFEWEVDADGLIHVLTSTTYWTGRGTDWASEPAPAMGYQFWLAIDRDGSAHVITTLALPEWEEVLRHGTNASGGWVFEDLTSTFGVGHVDLKVSEAGDLHLVFSRDTYSYMSRLDGVWTTPVTIDGESTRGKLPPTATFGPLAIAPSGDVHVAYHLYPDGVGSDGSLRHAELRSGAWVVENLRESKSLGSPVGMDVDPTGRIHVLNRMDGQVTYTRNCD